MSLLNWDFDLGEPWVPNPKNIIERLLSSGDTSEISFCASPLSKYMESRPTASAYFDFDQEYRKSVEMAWVSIRALLEGIIKDSACDKLVDNALNVTRCAEYGTIKLTLTAEGAAALRSSKFTSNDLERYSVVPDVIGSLVYALYQDIKNLEFGLTDCDVAELCKSDQKNVLAITAADFGRATGSLQTCEGAQGEYFNSTGVRNYGWDTFYGDAKYRFRGAPKEPYTDQGGEIRFIPSFLCFRPFTNNSVAGLVIALDKELNVESPGASVAETNPAMPSTMWWMNNTFSGECDADPSNKFSAYFARLGDEGKNWERWSVAPYLIYKDRELSERESFDHMLIINTGVSFSNQHMMGLFVTFCLKTVSEQTGESFRREVLPKVLSGIRAHLGHERFLLLDSLATEIANIAENLRQSEKELSDKLRAASLPFAAQHGSFLLFLEAAKKVRLVIDPFFIDDTSIRIAQLRASEIMNQDNAKYHTHAAVIGLPEGAPLTSLLNVYFKELNDRASEQVDFGKTLTNLVVEASINTSVLAEKWCLAHACYRGTISLKILTGENDHIGIELACLGEKPGETESEVKLRYAAAWLAKWKASGFEFWLDRSGADTFLLVKPKEAIRDWAGGLKPAIQNWLDGTRSKGDMSKSWATVLRGCAGPLEPAAFKEWFDGIEYASEKLKIRIGIKDEIGTAG